MPEEVLKKDLEFIIDAAYRTNIPFIASLGGDGSDVHVEKALKLVDEISREKNMRLKIAVISGEIDKEWLKDKLRKGFKAERIYEHPRLSKYLTIEDIDRSKIIVAQMGPEPIMKALDLYFKGEIDGILTGRALDIGLFATLPLKKGFDIALTMHMAKILECGALSCEPSSPSDGALGILRKDHFLITCPNPKRRATVRSVAAHAFYERVNPFREENPGGILDVSNAIYEQIDEKTVKVSGSKWIPTKYTIKLEGVSLIGYRAISIAGVRDPFFINQLDYILDKVKQETDKYFSFLPKDSYKINFKIYGVNAILRNAELISHAKPHEICILIDVIGKTQSIANSICSFISSQLSHIGFPGRKSTAGNIAYPFSPTRYIPIGEVYIFNIWHRLEIEDPYEPFKIKIIEFPRR